MFDMFVLLLVTVDITDTVENKYSCALSCTGHRRRRQLVNRRDENSIKNIDRQQ